MRGENQDKNMFLISLKIDILDILLCLRFFLYKSAML